MKPKKKKESRASFTFILGLKKKNPTTTNTKKSPKESILFFFSSHYSFTQLILVTTLQFFC